MGRSTHKDPPPPAASHPSRLEGLGSPLAGSSAPKANSPRRGRRAAAALAVLLLALLFVLPLGRESGIGVASPSPSPSGAASAEPSATPSTPVEPTVAPTPVSPLPTSLPSATPSPTTSPSGGPIVVVTCSSNVGIDLASQWADGRFIVRTITVTIPTAGCDGASAQVLLLEASGGILLRRDGVIANQQLVFEVSSEEIPSLTVQSAAIEITASGTNTGS